MRDSLAKKIEMLKGIEFLCEKQRIIVSEQNVDWDSFDRNVEAKGVLIDQILKLDEGFESLYNRIKEELSASKSFYSSEIAELQNMIKSITDLGTKIEMLEKNNRTLIEAAFASERKYIKQLKTGSKAALEYYNKMNKLNMVDPQLMDKKS